MSLAILVWSASLDAPERAATPFFFAQAAAALETRVEMYFTGPAVKLLLSASQSIRIGYGEGAQTLATYIADTDALDVRMFACSQALAGLRIARSELCLSRIELGGAVQFVGRTLDQNWRTLTF